MALLFLAKGVFRFLEIIFFLIQGNSNIYIPISQKKEPTI